MENNKEEKTPIVVSKSFMAFGPTLHYSHKNVQRYWILSIIVFGLSCLFWSKLASGSFWSVGIGDVSRPEFWRLDQSLVTVISIFEYPWQIFVLGLLMGILAIVPVLTSQLMSFEYSLPFILEVVFLANLPGFALCLLISCFAVACRPLRFRSRFIAVALCSAPQLAYLAYFGSVRSVEPIEWGFSFAPWVSAWLESLIIAGFVLGIGHFTRYKPGLVWIFTFLTLVIAVVVFEVAIGFDELDYQLYIAKNNPEHVIEFKDYSISQELDAATADPNAIRKDLFYPTNPSTLRDELKREIQRQLSYDHWPSWFHIPEQLEYARKKEWLLRQYDLFINKGSNGHRMPIALYFKAILSDYQPDIRLLGEEEILHFYSDIPHESSGDIWFRLYRDFGNSPESLEARWRISKLWAGRGLFEQAEGLLDETQPMIAEQIKVLQAKQGPNETLLRLFQAPVETVMTIPRLDDLQRRLDQLRNLIGPCNRTAEPESRDRLARFVMLDPHSLNYSQQLDRMLQQTPANDPLVDNILLAQAKLISNEHFRAEKLAELHKAHRDSDGGIQALYELGLLKIGFWRRQEKSNTDQKKECLVEAKTILTSFLSLYPNSFYTEQIQKNLDSLPSN